MNSMEFVTYRLKDILCNYDNLRKPLSSMERVSFQGDYPYFGAQGIIDHVRDYRYDGEYLLIAEDGENLKARSQPIAIIATGKFWVNNHAHVVKTNELADIKYTCYALNNMDISGYVTGTAQPKLSQKNLNGMKVLFPTLEKQKHIAEILSAYDELIENNNRRIALLEKAAQELYKEWFVRFRFPGHETAKFENGLPEGWMVMRVKDLVKRYPFGTLYKGDSILSEGKTIVIDQSSNEYAGFHNNEPSHIADINYPMILFGDHTCKYQLMTIPFSLSENVVPFTGTEGVETTYLYYLVNGIVETTEYKRHWTEFVSKKVLVADNKSQCLFRDKIKDKLLLIESLKLQNQNLAKQRDLLLPRLMSGKLEV